MAAVCACALLVSACTQRGQSASASVDKDAAYYEGFSLVYWQSSKLQNIDKLLLVKFEREEINGITKRVSEISARVAEDLESRAAQDSRIELEAEYLPLIEAGARDKMGFNIARELLFTGGCDFEERLVFTEAVAILRLSALAEMMAETAPDDSQSSFWSGVHDESAALFEDLRDLINRCPEE